MEIIEKTKPILGQGIFTIKDVASILNLPTPKINRVLTNFWDGRFGSEENIQYSWGEGKEKSVNFYTLIEFYTFYQLRELGKSVHDIAKSHRILSQHFETPYPFAKSNLLLDGGKILFKQDGGLFTADKKMEGKMTAIIEPFCKKIEFGSDLLAEKFYPKGKEINIVINPHHQFGQPTIDNSNILAETIYRMYLANEKPEFIAEVYELELKEVNDAIFFYKNAA